MAKDDDRREEHECVAFDFLGYTFQPRRAKSRWGKYFVSFLSAMSTKAASAVRVTIRDWRMASTRNNQSLEDLARLINPTARGWLNYFGRLLTGQVHAGPSTSQRGVRRVGAPQVQAVSAA